MSFSIVTITLGVGGRRSEAKLSYDTESKYENSRTQRSQHLPKPTTTPSLEGT